MNSKGISLTLDNKLEGIGVPIILKEFSPYSTFELSKTPETA